MTPYKTLTAVAALSLLTFACGSSSGPSSEAVEQESDLQSSEARALTGSWIIAAEAGDAETSNLGLQFRPDGSFWEWTRSGRRIDRRDGAYTAKGGCAAGQRSCAGTLTLRYSDGEVTSFEQERTAQPAGEEGDRNFAMSLRSKDGAVFHYRARVSFCGTSDSSATECGTQMTDKTWNPELPWTCTIDGKTGEQCAYCTQNADPMKSVCGVLAP